MLTPPFDEHSSCPERIEDFPVQELIPQFAIKTLIIAILPGDVGPLSGQVLIRTEGGFGRLMALTLSQKLIRGQVAE